MCQKRQHRCPLLLALREQALQEWVVAESFEDVRACWSRLGGLVTLHRYGPTHYSLLARHRWGDTEAGRMLVARMARRKS